MRWSKGEKPRACHEHAQQPLHTDCTTEKARDHLTLPLVSLLRKPINTTFFLPFFFIHPIHFPTASFHRMSAAGTHEHGLNKQVFDRKPPIHFSQDSVKQARDLGGFSFHVFRILKIFVSDDFAHFYSIADEGLPLDFVSTMGNRHVTNIAASSPTLATFHDIEN